MNTLKLSFTSLAFALALTVSGCGRNPPQADNKMSEPVTDANQPQMNGATTNAMHDMASSPMDHMASMNNMASNNMSMANSPQTGHMMSGSMMASNQPQMNDMTTNSMHNMAAPQTGNMESH